MRKITIAALAFAVAQAAVADFIVPEGHEPDTPGFSFAGDSFWSSGGSWVGEGGGVFPADYFSNEEDATLRETLEVLLAGWEDNFLDIDRTIAAVSALEDRVHKLEGEDRGDGCDACQGGKGCLSKFAAEKEERIQADDELSQRIADERDARIEADNSKASIVELDTERTDRGAADAEILAIIASLHNGVPGDSLSNLLATVAFTGNYGDLDGKPQASFLIDLTSSGPSDGPIDVTFHQGSLGSTNVTDFSFTIPKCKWDDSLLDGIRDRLDSLESDVSGHEGRIAALEALPYKPCNCSGDGGGGESGGGGIEDIDLSDYVTWDDLNALDLGSGCNCNLAGINAQLSTLRTELIRLLNYVGYQEHQNMPRR